MPRGVPRASNPEAYGDSVPVPDASEGNITVPGEPASNLTPLGEELLAAAQEGQAARDRGEQTDIIDLSTLPESYLGSDTLTGEKHVIEIVPAAPTIADEVSHFETLKQGGLDDQTAFAIVWPNQDPELFDPYLELANSGLQVSLPETSAFDEFYAEDPWASFLGTAEELRAAKYAAIEDSAIAKAYLDPEPVETPFEEIR